MKTLTLTQIHCYLYITREKKVTQLLLKVFPAFDYMICVLDIFVKLVRDILHNKRRTKLHILSGEKC